MATSEQAILLDNESATGSAVIWPGGEGTFHVVGTFGGATVSLQRLGPDDSTWTDVGADVILTAEGMGNFNVGAGKIRAEIVGGSPSGIYAEASGTGR
jgi:hypothetical protein